MRWRLCTLGLLLVVAASVRSDEIRLKDGSKIVGTIVDFENESFKVQTAYGFAMVRKDSIEQIIPAEPSKSGEAAKAAAPALSVKPAAVSSPVVKAEPQPAVSRNATAPNPMPAASATAAPAAATPLPMPTPNPRPGPPASAVVVSSEPTPTLAAVPTPSPVVPGPIRESVQGSLYTNETYNFRFYRPPGWDVMPEARQALPNAITAMGTSDRATLFVIGREPVRDSLEAQASSAERALQKVYENYRMISSTKRTVSGRPAIEWRFRGLADGHDWSVTVLTIANGSDVFTLLGMAYADSDLIIQIRENVIAKMMASLQFSAQR